MMIREANDVFGTETNPTALVRPTQDWPREQWIAEHCVAEYISESEGQQHRGRHNSVVEPVVGEHAVNL